MNDAKQNKTSEWIDGNNAARILGVTSATLRNWIRNGKIQPRRLSKKYSRSDIELIRSDGTGGGSDV